MPSLSSGPLPPLWTTSTAIPDWMYYEITYNGDKGEMYLDAYKKMHNECIKIEED